MWAVNPNLGNGASKLYLRWVTKPVALSVCLCEVAMAQLSEEVDLLDTSYCH